MHKIFLIGVAVAAVAGFSREKEELAYVASAEDFYQPVTEIQPTAVKPIDSIDPVPMAQEATVDISQMVEQNIAEYISAQMDEWGEAYTNKPLVAFIVDLAKAEEAERVIAYIKELLKENQKDAVQAIIEELAKEKCFDSIIAVISKLADAKQYDLIVSSIKALSEAQQVDIIRKTIKALIAANQTEAFRECLKTLAKAEYIDAVAATIVVLVAEDRIQEVEAFIKRLPPEKIVHIVGRVLARLTRQQQRRAVVAILAAVIKRDVEKMAAANIKAVARASMSTPSEMDRWTAISGHEAISEHQELPEGQVPRNFLSKVEARVYDLWVRGREAYLNGDKEEEERCHRDIAIFLQKLP